MTKADLTFQALSSGFVNFAVQFCFCLKFSFHEKWRSSQVWQWAWSSSWTNLNWLLRIATNEIALFCIRKTHYVKWLYSFSRRLLSLHVERFSNKKSFWCRCLFLYYLKQIDSLLPRQCLFSIRSQKPPKCLKNISDTWLSPGVPLFCQFDVICDLLLNRRTATWIYFLDFKKTETGVSTSGVFWQEKKY